MGHNEGRLGGGPGKDGMTLDTGDYLNILKDDIHSAVFATVDRDGHPAARVIDIMLTDENTLYFITAKGKEFYRQLTERKYVAISGMTGGGVLSAKGHIHPGRGEGTGGRTGRQGI